MSPRLEGTSTSHHFRCTQTHDIVRWGSLESAESQIFDVVAAGPAIGALDLVWMQTHEQSSTARVPGCMWLTEERVSVRKVSTEGRRHLSLSC